ncbi:hypothetical protein TKK_0006697 [Trichogramma kaykai]
MKDITLEIIRVGSYIYGHFDGYLFRIRHSANEGLYWECWDCPASLKTTNEELGLPVKILRVEDYHINHAPDHERIKNLRLKARNTPASK